MLVSETRQFVPWQPNFSSSGQENPDWTKLICDGVELSNAITWVEWFDEAEPAVQVQLCEACGIPGCQSGGYVHVSRLGNHVLWTHPHIDPSDSFASYQYRPSEAVSTHGAVAFPIRQWNSWSEELAGLPPATEFARTMRRDLLSAWQSEAPLFGRWDSPDQLLSMARERAVAGEPSEPSDALESLDALVRWFREAPDDFVDGELVPFSAGERTGETLYFDVPDTFDRPVLREWTPLARREGRVTPLFGGELVLVPEPI
ncbi:MAG TPA: hypothetical protein VK488_12980 [Gaiellaceae bacterium]|nr:hypothetical protein [Gaiellaceae bacterium]